MRQQVENCLISVRGAFVWLILVVAVMRIGGIVYRETLSQSLVRHCLSTLKSGQSDYAGSEKLKDIVALESRIFMTLISPEWDNICTSFRKRESDFAFFSNLPVDNSLVLVLWQDFIDCLKRENQAHSFADLDSINVYKNCRPIVEKQAEAELKWSLEIYMHNCGIDAI